MTNGTGRYIEIQEKLNPSVRHALAEQFPKPTYALLELVDNSVASQTPGKILEVRITIKPNHISITDKWGQGMNQEQLETFLEWGFAPRTGIFQYHGQGGKAALAYLADNFKLWSTPIGGKVTYYVQVTDFQKHLDELRTLKFEVQDAVWEFPTVTFDLTGLRRHVRPTEVKHCLAETYRPLLLSDTIRIWVNASRVVPVDLPYDSRIDLDEITPFGHLTGWIGLKPETSQVRGGIRCYSQGRLVCKREFFGLETPSFDYERVIGEVELAFVPFTTLKADFDRASEQWKAAQIAIAPAMNALAKKIVHTTTDIKGLTKMLPEIRKVITEIFRQAGEPFAIVGRKPPETHGEVTRPLPHEHQISLKMPATPPPDKAVGDTRRQPSWAATEMDEAIRSYSEENGRILVNSVYPAFRATFQLQKRDPRPFYGHIAETIALEWYTRDGTPAIEIKERVNHILKVAYER